MSTPTENSNDESMPTFNGNSPEVSQEMSSPEASVAEGSQEMSASSSMVEEAPSIEEEVPSMDEEAPSIEEEAPSMDEEAPAMDEEAPSVAETPSEEGERLEEPIISESKQMDKDKRMLDEASIFRRKLTSTKKKMPSMDDHQKDEIRNGVIREFINILKISKRATTRKKLGRRINNLRGVFNETLDMLNGTAKKHPKKRKTKKQKMESEPEPESFSETEAQP